MPPIRIGLGVSFTILGVLSFSLLDLITKYATSNYPMMQLAWARLIFHFALVAPLLSKREWIGLLKPDQLAIQTIRALAVLGAGFAFIASFFYLPLAEVTAISFLAPLLVVILGVPLLKEHVGPSHYSVVLLGLASIWIIIRPGTDVFHWAAIFPLLAAVCHALYQITTKMLSGSESVMVVLQYPAFVGSIILSGIVPFVWVTPSTIGWLMFLGMGLFGMLGHVFLIKALDFAPATAITSYHYTQILFATIWGYIFFGEFPDNYTITGTTILIASGLYLFHLQRRSV